MKVQNAFVIRNLKLINMRIFILFISIFLAFSVKSQDSLKTIKMEVHGFVKSDYWTDSRQVLQSREGLFSLFPQPVKLDALGNDLNAHSSFNFTAISTRANLKFFGPDAFGAKTTAFIEGDFTGISNATINTLRLRHAWIRFQWKRTAIIAGQDWHPMFVTQVYPGVLALNTGAPFQPFNRSPQIRFESKFGKMKLILAAISQRDNTNIGPIGRDFSYMSNSMIPNLHGQVQFSTSKHFFGAAIDWKSIMPRIITDSNIYTSQRLNTKSAMVFHKFSRKKFEIKSKLIYGENLSENLMLGGYAVATEDSVTNEQTYTSSRHLFAWTNLIFKFKKKNYLFMPAIFAGYAQNLASAENNLGIWYATGSDIDNLIRVAPGLSVRNGPIMLTFEYEFTRAYYGSLDNRGRVINANPIDNHRVMLAAFYFF